MGFSKKRRYGAARPLQQSFLMPATSWAPPQVSSLPSWAGAKRVALDCETRDDELRALGPGVRRGAYTVGWAFKIEGGPKHYLPIRHEGGGNLPVGEVLGYLKENLKNFKGEIVGANLSYDIDYALADGLQFNPDVKFRDIQIADPLIYELHRSYSLKNIAERLGVKGKEINTLFEAAAAVRVDPYSNIWRLPARYVGEYAENDVEAPLLIYEKQRRLIERNDLWQIFDLETALLPILVKMRRRGVRVDFDKLTSIEKWAYEEEVEALRRVRHETGVSVAIDGVWKAAALAPALEAIGVKLEKTKTGAVSIDAKALDSVGHPVAKAIKHARKVNKLRTTFAASIHRYATNGRIHCSFHQIIAQSNDGRDQKGVRYGRLSATDPNIQQQPSPDRDPVIAGEWRKIFLPEEGAVWGCNDYSQQEPRWVTHYAAVMKLPKGQEAARRYREDHKTDNHDMMTRLIHGDAQTEQWLATDPKGAYKVHRGFAKSIFLGLCYGEGGAKLCKEIGKPTRWALFKEWGKPVYFTNIYDAWSAKAECAGGAVREVAGEEGQAIIDNFNEKVPYVRALAQEAQKLAQRRGYVRTILGRKLHFEEKQGGGYEWVHKALNRVIQGSSADQTKKALIDLDRAGYYIQLQVHDEIDGSYSTIEEAKAVGEVMKTSILDKCTPLVPFNVDTECGKSWGELKSV